MNPLASHSGQETGKPPPFPLVFIGVLAGSKCCFKSVCAGGICVNAIVSRYLGHVLSHRSA